MLTPPKGPQAPLDQTPLEETNPWLAKALDFTQGVLGLKQEPGRTPSGYGALLGAALPLGALGKAKWVSPRAQLADQLAQEGKALRAYHGSPHEFDRFDLSQIGSGTGVQSYGHGLYFAEEPQVALNYQEQLSKPTYAQILSILKDTGKLQVPPLKGSLYEVNLNTSPERLLDWDTVLNQQGKLGERVASALPPTHYPAEKMVGSEALSRLHDTKTAEGIPKLLRDFDIPGLRYLDQMSREAGQGTHNYVIWDPAIIDILRKY